MKNVIYTISGIIILAVLFYMQPQRIDIMGDGVMQDTVIIEPLKANSTDLHKDDWGLVITSVPCNPPTSDGGVCHTIMRVPK